MVIGQKASTEAHERCKLRRDNRRRLRDLEGAWRLEIVNLPHADSNVPFVLSFHAAALFGNRKSSEAWSPGFVWDRVSDLVRRPQSAAGDSVSTQPEDPPP